MALRFLRHFGAVAPAFVDRHLVNRRDAEAEGRSRSPIRHDRHQRVRVPWPQSDLLSIVPEAGTLIARDGDREIRTPYDDCVLIMPTRRTAKGDTAVRLGRFVG